MTKIFKNTNKPLFVSKADKISQRDKYAVILSPEFYWSKKVTLPVKKVKDALKLAPSVYDGYLPEGNFSYEARKVGEEFIIIAYDKKAISADLEKVFTHKSDMAAIYFAQDALPHIEECTAVDDRAALSNMDGIIIQVPRACTNTAHTLDEMLKDAKLDKAKVKLSAFDNVLLSSGDIKIIASIFGILFLAFMSEYIAYKKAIGSLDDKRTAMIQQYDLPGTSIQLKSIKKSLHKKFATQKKLREMLFALSKINLQKGEYIESIEESVKETKVKIHVLSKEREAAIKKMLPKNIMIKESHFKENTLNLRIAS